jgi:hypothetical protein
MRIEMVDFTSSIGTRPAVPSAQRVWVGDAVEEGNGWCFSGCVVRGGGEAL